MIIKPLRPLLLALALATTALSPALAQEGATQSPSGLTREQAKMQRDAFMKIHRWDDDTDSWKLKDGVEATLGMKSRDQVRGERDQFLRNNRYDVVTSTWVPLKTKPRNLATMSRAQVRSETARFVQSHRWDVETEAWILRTPATRIQ